MRTLPVFLVLTSLVLLLLRVQATTYYISEADGDYSNSATEGMMQTFTWALLLHSHSFSVRTNPTALRCLAQSMSTPWKTLTPASKLTSVSPGDQFLLQRGGSYRGDLPSA